MYQSLFCRYDKTPTIRGNAWRNCLFCLVSPQRESLLWWGLGVGVVLGDWSRKLQDRIFDHKLKTEREKEG